jgi:hypothetical protein
MWNSYFDDQYSYKTLYGVNNLKRISYYSDRGDPTWHPVDYDGVTPITIDTNTPIEKIGYNLYRWIIDPANGVNHRIDIITHSMGGIVARSMICNYYTKLVEAGFRIDDIVQLAPPNFGTTIANVYFFGFRPLYIPQLVEFFSAYSTFEMNPGSSFLNSLYVDGDPTPYGKDDIHFAQMGLNHITWYTYRGNNPGYAGDQGFLYANAILFWAFPGIHVANDGMVDTDSSPLPGAYNRGPYPYDHNYMASHPDIIRSVYWDVFDYTSTPPPSIKISHYSITGLTGGAGNIQLSVQVSSNSPDIIISEVYASVIPVNTGPPTFPHLDMDQTIDGIYAASLNVIDSKYNVLIHAEAVGGYIYEEYQTDFMFDEDISPPTLSISPMDKTFTDENPFIQGTWDASDSSGLYEVTVKLDNNVIASNYLNPPIAASPDDATFSPTWGWSNTDFNLYIGRPSIIEDSYLRFPINIPRGTNIFTGNLKIYVSTKVGNPTFKIYLLDSDYCPAFPNSGSSTSNYPLTYTYVSWTPSIGWNTIDISTLLTAFIQRNGYITGNCIGLKIDNNGVGSGIYIRASAFDEGLDTACLDIMTNVGSHVSGTLMIPNELGVHTLEVYAKDNDYNPYHFGGADADRLENTITSTIKIVDDDIQGPQINIQYEGSSFLDDPGHWNVKFLDQHSSRIVNAKVDGNLVTGHFNGADSFTADTVGLPPAGWIIGFYNLPDIPNDIAIGEGYNVAVAEEYKGHSNVLKLEKPDGGSATPTAELDFPEGHTNGAIEMWALTPSPSDEARFIKIGRSQPTPQSVNGNEIAAVVMRLYNGQLQRLVSAELHGSIWGPGPPLTITLQYEDICPYTPDTWIHIRVTFECSDGVYDGLGREQYKAYVINTPPYNSETTYGPFPFIDKAYELANAIYPGSITGGTVTPEPFWLGYYTELYDDDSTNYITLTESGADNLQLEAGIASNVPSSYLRSAYEPDERWLSVAYKQGADQEPFNLYLWNFESPAYTPIANEFLIVEGTGASTYWDTWPVYFGLSYTRILAWDSSQGDSLVYRVGGTDYPLTYGTHYTVSEGGEIALTYNNYNTNDINTGQGYCLSKGVPGQFIATYRAMGGWSPSPKLIDGNIYSLPPGDHKTTPLIFPLSVDEINPTDMFFATRFRLEGTDATKQSSLQLYAFDIVHHDDVVIKRMLLQAYGPVDEYASAYFDAIDYSWAQGYQTNRNMDLTLSMDVNEVQTGHYIGKYSFMETTMSQTPTDWEFHETTPNSWIEVVDEIAGHQKIVKLVNNGNSPTATQIFGNRNPTEKQDLEFWVYGEKGSRMDIDIQQTGFGWGDYLWLQLRFNENKLINIYNYGKTSEILSNALTEETWHHIRITVGWNSFQIWLNGVYLNTHSSFIPCSQFYTRIVFYAPTLGTAYFDAVDYSWDSGYYTNRNMDSLIESALKGGIDVPARPGLNTVEISAHDLDSDRPNDQATSSASQTVSIYANTLITSDITAEFSDLASIEAHIEGDFIADQPIQFYIDLNENNQLNSGDIDLGICCTNIQGVAQFQWRCTLPFGDYQLRVEYLSPGDLFQSRESIIHVQREKDLVLLLPQSPSVDWMDTLPYTVTLSEDGLPIVGKEVKLLYPAYNMMVVDSAITDAQGDALLELKYNEFPLPTYDLGPHSVIVAVDQDNYYEKAESLGTYIVTSEDDTSMTDFSRIVEYGDSFSLITTVSEDGNPFPYNPISIIFFIDLNGNYLYDDKIDFLLGKTNTDASGTAQLSLDWTTVDYSIYLTLGYIRMQWNAIFAECLENTPLFSVLVRYGLLFISKEPDMQITLNKPTLQCKYNQLITATATLTEDGNPCPFKKVTFYVDLNDNNIYDKDYDVFLGEAYTGPLGRAIITTLCPIKTPGTYAYRAEFNGDDYYEAVSCEGIFIVQGNLVILNNIPSDTPDLDLHIYTDEGQHIGINYATNEPEIEIEGAFYSGDLVGETEWIYLPPNVTDYYVIVDARNAEFPIEDYNLTIITSTPQNISTQVSFAATIPAGGMEAWAPQIAPATGELVVQPLNVTITQNFEQLRAMIRQLNATAFDKNPAQRKITLTNKIQKVIGLVEAQDYWEAYEELLYDIKPKLTGLKTDEKELPWGKGVFKDPWVIDLSAQEILRNQCNKILTELKLIVTLREKMITEKLGALNATIMHLNNTAFDRNPAQRKAALSDEIQDVIIMVKAKNYCGAYEKLLHDIKPKLTGLKIDENKIPWCKGVFKNPWVIDFNAQKLLRDQCDQLLSELRLMM